MRIGTEMMGRALVAAPDGSTIVSRNSFHNCESVGPPSVGGRAEWGPPTCLQRACMCEPWITSFVRLPSGREVALDIVGAWRCLADPVLLGIPEVHAEAELAE